MKLKVLFVWASTLLLSACSGGSSDDAKTNNLTAQFRVISSSDGIIFEAQFYRSDIPISLDAGDAAKVYVSDERIITLTEQEVPGLYSSIMNISSRYADKNFRFALERGEKIGAPNSNIFLPKAFTAASEQTAGTIYYTDPITVTWEGEGAADTSFNIVRLYECLDNEETEFLYQQESRFEDIDGSAIIDDSALLIDDNLVSCEATFELGRSASSGVDDRFKGGKVIAIQSRDLTFSLVFVQPEPEPEPEPAALQLFY